MITRKQLLGTIAAGAVASSVAPALAHAEAGPVAFAGSCSVTGVARFLPPGGFLPALTEDEYVFQSQQPSTCSGQLYVNGSPVGGTRTWPVDVEATNHGHLSCAASVELSGDAQIAFLNRDGGVARAGRVPLIARFLLDTVSVGGDILLHATGGSNAAYPHGTNATGTAQFAVDQQTLQGCADATIGQLSFTASIQTGPSVPASPSGSTAILLSR